MGAPIQIGSEIPPTDDNKGQPILLETSLAAVTSCPNTDIPSDTVTDAT